MASKKAEAAAAVVEEEVKTIKKTAKKASATAKKAVEDVAAAVQETTVNVEELAAAKKPAARRTKKIQEEYFVEFDGISVSMNTVQERIAEVIKAEKNVKAENVKVYVKPQDGKAYYVINDDVTGSVDLF